MSLSFRYKKKPTFNKLHKDNNSNGFVQELLVGRKSLDTVIKYKHVTMLMTNHGP